MRKNSRHLPCAVRPLARLHRVALRLAVCGRARRAGARRRRDRAARGFSQAAPLGRGADPPGLCRAVRHQARQRERDHRAYRGVRRSAGREAADAGRARRVAAQRLAEGRARRRRAGRHAGPAIPARSAMRGSSISTPTTASASCAFRSPTAQPRDRQFRIELSLSDGPGSCPASICRSALQGAPRARADEAEGKTGLEIDAGSCAPHLRAHAPRRSSHLALLLAAPAAQAGYARCLQRSARCSA